MRAPGLELAGIEFIDENGGGPGVRLRNIRRVELLRIELDHHVLSDRPSLMPLLSTSCITI
jgi:hypothetical protein